MENITAREVAALAPAPRLDIAAVIAQMRDAGRLNLIHYAGAAHRDLVAWHFCWCYLADPTARERDIKAIALRCAWGIEVNPEHICETPAVRS
jgi:hypothetical protein